MRTLILAAVVLLPMPTLLAQGSAQEQYDKLVADHAELRKGYSAAQRDVMAGDAYKLAVAAGDRQRESALLMAVLEPPTELIAVALPAAEDFTGAEGAIPFLEWIVTNVRADGFAVRTAADILVRDHIASEQLVEFARGIGHKTDILGQRKVAEIESALLAKNPDPMVKAQVYNTRAQLLDGRGATEAQQKEALGFYKNVVELLAESDSEEAKRLAGSAAGSVFVVERLQIGMVAPEIEAEDLDGVNFKLSDYRGKVVVIDFWGDW